MMINIYNEEKLSTKDRKELPASIYGLPSEKKYPLNDANHVRSAMAYFNHCDKNKKKWYLYTGGKNGLTWQRYNFSNLPTHAQDMADMHIGNSNPNVYEYMYGKDSSGRDMLRIVPRHGNIKKGEGRTVWTPEVWENEQ